MQLTLFFFIPFILSHRALLSSHQFSHLSHLPAHAIVVPIHASLTHAILAHAIAIYQALISQSLISLIKLSSPSPHRRRPNPCRLVLPTLPIHAFAQSSDQTHAISLFSLL